MRRNRREIPVEREQELLSAFVEAYGSSETRVAVDRFLRALFSARREPPAGQVLAAQVLAAQEPVSEEPATDRESAA